MLLGYLFVHIWVISHGRVDGPQSLDNLFRTFDKPFLVFLDLMLVAAVLYHALNGVRVVLMDFGIGIQRAQGRLLDVHGWSPWRRSASFAFKASTYIF